MMLSLLVLACRGRGNNPASATETMQTISPAAAQPAQTDTAEMTQTVNIEDSRSEAEGAGTDMAPPATTTAQPPPKKTKTK